MSTCISLIESNVKFKKADADVILLILKDFAKNNKLRWG